MDFTQALGNFGFRYRLNWKGRDYVFSFLSDKQKGWYEIWMKETELENINGATDIPRDTQEEMYRTFLRDVKLGEFRFGGRYYKKYYATEAGKIRFIMMLLVENHPHISERDVESMMNDPECERKLTGILSLIVAESTLEIAKATPEQKAEALENIYRTLIKSPMEGGLGLTIETIRDMTDRQKIELLASNGKEEPKRAEVDAREVEEIDAKLRELARMQGVA